MQLAKIFRILSIVSFVILACTIAGCVDFHSIKVGDFGTQGSGAAGGPVNDDGQGNAQVLITETPTTVALADNPLSKPDITTVPPEDLRGSSGGDCRIQATAVLFAAGKTWPGGTRFGWGDRITFQGSSTNCSLPINLRIAGPGLPSGGAIITKPNNPNPGLASITRTGAFTLYWSSREIEEFKSWKSYPAQQGGYTAVFEDAGGNTSSPIPLDFSGPPACMIIGTIVTSRYPSVWGDVIKVPTTGENCPSGIDILLEKMPEPAGQIGSGGYRIAHLSPVNGDLYEEYPLETGLVKNKYGLTDGTYMIYLKDAGGYGEYTKVQFSIQSPVITSLPITTVPITTNQPVFTTLPVSQTPPVITAVPVTTTQPVISQTPACPSGQIKCNGICVDLQNSLANCGTCGNTCTNYPHSQSVCTLGKCDYTCMSGYVKYSGGCSLPPN
jgi:hypothetical protein